MKSWNGIGTCYFLKIFFGMNFVFYLTQLNHTQMKTLSRQYESAKERANEFMRKGQIPQYFDALLEMNRYKKLMVAVIAN
ncbi:hypothetical protein SAMN04489761_2737 [Tenacibaculum sp. MAR_2009_124]|nr:hypothetical protein SAMN04489761_2737 [Tenacibaculum sp. MAR_2009_124]